MLSSIESKIHNILLDIDPSLKHDYGEQSIIVAEAAANYNFSKDKNKVIYASYKETEKAEEALMIDGLLQAMNTQAQNDMGRYACTDYLNIADDELDYESILRNLRFCSKDFGKMDIVNDSDLNELLEVDKDDNLLFDIQDIFEKEHNPDIYRKPNIKKHRTDSLSR